jgi:hypothetical protein
MKQSQIPKKKGRKPGSKNKKTLEREAKEAEMRSKKISKVADNFFIIYGYFFNLLKSS